MFETRKRDAQNGVTWKRTPGTELTAAPVPQAPTEVDAIGELLGDYPAPVVVSRWRPSWPLLRWMLIVVPLLGVAAPIYLWLQYDSQHVSSKNAAVRGQLAEIGTRLNGIVSSVAVDVGDSVAAGQVLVQLEDRHLKAEVEEARAEVAGLRRTIEVEQVTMQLERRDIEQEAVRAVAGVAAAEAQTEAARIEAEDARRKHEVLVELYSRDGAVSGQEVHDAESRRRTAEARLEEARANAVVAAQSVERGVRLARDELILRERGLGVLEANLLSAQARLKRAEADLEGATIRAPDDGAIVRRIIQPGGAIEVGQPVIVMLLGDDIWVEAWIDEEDLGFVQFGSTATVTFHSFPGREFTGFVDKIGLATDLEIPDSEVPQPRSSRMRAAPVVGVRIRLHDPPPDLRPGLSAVVAITKSG